MTESVPLSKLVNGRGISYGIVQPGSEVTDGVPVIRVNNMAGNRIDLTDVKRVAPDIESNYERTRLRGGELLLSLVGTLGLAAIAPPQTKGWNVARAVGVVPIDDPELAYWVLLNLRSAPVQHFIRTRATTTVQATFNLRDVAEIPIPMPPKGHRRRVCHIVKAYDDKIELNRRMNETLEAMARAIFKSWFVDFDPVRAKTEGRQPQGIPAHIADLFPDSFQDSPLGPIPKGWSVESIGEVVDCVGGATPSTKDARYWDGGTNCFATPKDLSGLKFPVLLDTERHVTQAGVDKISSGLLPKGTVLLSSRAPIGYLSIAEVPVCVNQGFVAMKCNTRVPNLFVLRWAEANMDAIKANANGSTFLEISKRNFRPIPITLPSKEVMAAFMEMVRPLHNLMVNNERESRTLASTRDTLLPKLLSGEVIVSAKLGVPE